MKSAKALTWILPFVMIACGLTVVGCAELASSMAASETAARYVAEPRQIGTPDPIVFQAAAPDGSWVVICQARVDTNGDGVISLRQGYHGDFHGDKLNPHLVIGSGPGRLLDDFVAADASGRYVVVVIDKRLLLIDTRSGNQIDLSARGANPDDDAMPTGRHRAASFDRAGKKLLYLRRNANRETAIVRDLSTGDEAEIDPGAGQLFRAALDPDGHWVRIAVVDRDTDGDGKLTLPYLQTTLAPRRCRGIVASYSTYGFSGDRLTQRIAPASGGLARELPDVVRPFGDRLLRRAPDGTLQIQSRTNQVDRLAPAACQGRLLHADPARNMSLISCQSSRPPMLFLYGIGEEIPTNKPTPAIDSDTLENGDQRLVHYRDWLVDLERRKVHHIGDVRLLGQHGGRALLQKDKKLILLDSDDESAQEVGAVPSSILPYRASTMVLLAGPTDLPARVFDLSTGRFAGQVKGFPFAVASDGRALLLNSERNEGQYITGPLKWIKPN